MLGKQKKYERALRSSKLGDRPLRTEVIHHRDCMALKCNEEIGTPVHQRRTDTWFFNRHHEILKAQ